MKKPHLSFSRLLIILLAVAVVGTLFFVFAATSSSSPAPEPSDLVKTALTNTLSAQGLSFQSKSSLEIADKKLIYGDLSGITDGKGNFYLEGTLLGDPLELYYIDGITYIKDPLTNQWQKIAARNAALPDTPKLNPLANLEITDVGSCTLLETTGRFYKTTYKVQCQPTLADPWINENFYDIVYTFWISGKEPYITKAEISAKTASQDVVGILNITMNLADFNIEFHLEKPLP